MPQATLRANARALPTRRPPVSRALRRRLEGALENLLALLDELDGDPELEHSLGSTSTVNQEIAWRPTDCDNEREMDFAESGIGDLDGLAEQHGHIEPDLGATEHVDQRAGWGERPPLWSADREATGTEDDVELSKPWERRQADRRAAGAALDQVHAITRRRRAAPAHV